MNFLMKSISSAASNLGISVPDNRVRFDSGDDRMVRFEKSASWPIIHELMQNMGGVPRPADFNSYARVYSTVVWVYTCAWIISSSISGLDWWIIRRGRDGTEEEITEGLAIDLFNSPNEFEDLEELIEMTVLMLELTGNAFWELAGLLPTLQTGGMLPVKLFNLESQYMTIISAPRSKIGGYKFDMQSGHPPTLFGPHDIAHFKYANPVDQFYGMGPMAALVTTIITELYRENYSKSYFENEARPDVILKQNPDIYKGIPPIMSNDPSLLRVAKEWRTSFGGPKNNRLPVMLPAGMDIDILTEARQDMDFVIMENNLTRRILAAFGVTPVMAGLTDGINYANAKEQKKVFFTQTIPPKAKMIARVITRTILKPYDPELEFQFDLVNIAALEEDTKEKADRINSLVDRGLLTLGQARAELGIEVEKNDPYKNVRIVAGNYVLLDDIVGGMSAPEGTDTSESGELGSEEDNGNTSDEGGSPDGQQAESEEADAAGTEGTVSGGGNSASSAGGNTGSA